MPVRRRGLEAAPSVPGAGPGNGHDTANGNDCGMVSVEIALSLALVLLFAVIGAWLLAAGQLQARLTDAARATARELARGDSAADAIAAGHRITPDAQVEVVRDDKVIRVSAHQELRGPGPVLSGLRRTITATVVTEPEQESPW